ncbi:hypothetical protein FALCPG4_008532 [Fusarium falciforme]
MLFSGTDNHIAELGCMWKHMQMRKDYFKGQPGYERYLTHRITALPEILSDGGYFTVLSGKWHLGLTKEFAPCSRGFKKNFTFLPGSSNNHAYEPQLAMEALSTMGDPSTMATIIEKYYNNSTENLGS